jgi:hypothetical protein
MQCQRCGNPLPAGKTDCPYCRDASRWWRRAFALAFAGVALTAALAALAFRG